MAAWRPASGHFHSRFGLRSSTEPTYTPPPLDGHTRRSRDEPRPARGASRPAFPCVLEDGVSLEGYDLVMLGVLAGAAVLGYFKGMVWQLAWIAGIAVSTYAAFRFGPALAPTFGNQAPWNRFAAMLATYVGSSLGVWIVFRMISGAINAVHLSAFDHQLGLLLGLAKGALLCVVITFFAVTLAPNYRQQIVTSRSGRLVADLIVRADTYLPKELHETVSPFVKQFEQQFQGLPDSPAAAAGQPPAFAGQPNQLRAMWDGVTSAAAWTGTPAGAGGQQGPGATGGTPWFVPRSQPQPSGPVPAGYAAPANVYPSQPPASVFSAPQQQLPPARSFGPQAAPQQPVAPQRYPVGAQTLLPPR
jgi:membrane protein required for colicin V production